MYDNSDRMLGALLDADARAKQSNGRRPQVAKQPFSRLEGTPEEAREAQARIDALSRRPLSGKPGVPSPAQVASRPRVPLTVTPRTLVYTSR